MSYYPLFVLHILLQRNFFFFNDTATTEIYTLSLHDALPIWASREMNETEFLMEFPIQRQKTRSSFHSLRYPDRDRKSTRLNSSHSQISYAVFCLKKKKVGLERA